MLPYSSFWSLAFNENSNESSFWRGWKVAILFFLESCFQQLWWIVKLAKTVLPYSSFWSLAFNADWLSEKWGEIKLPYSSFWSLAFNTICKFNEGDQLSCHTLLFGVLLSTIVVIQLFVHFSCCHTLLFGVLLSTIMQ